MICLGSSTFQCVDGLFNACFTHPMRCVVNEKNVESVAFLKPSLVPLSLLLVVRLTCNDSELLDVDRL